MRKKSSGHYAVVTDKTNFEAYVKLWSQYQRQRRLFLKYDLTTGMLHGGYLFSHIQ